MTRILQIANALHYRPNGVPIATITQAIHVVGFERIRNLALSVLLLGHVQSKRSEEESREVAALSLSSGLLARGFMRPRDPGRGELTFVCTTLRS